MGLALWDFPEAVELMRLGYEDEKTFEMADKIFEFISYMAIDESADLARERGNYFNFEGSGWSRGRIPFDTMSDLEKSRGQKLDLDKTGHANELGLNWGEVRQKIQKGMRNATLMAVAPNANMGLWGTTPGIDRKICASIFKK